jgi:hypothetical protein
MKLAFKFCSLRKQHKKWTNTGHTRVCACGLTITNDSPASSALRRHRFDPPRQDHVVTLSLMSLRAATRTFALPQTTALRQNVQHGQEASPARFDGTTARVGHIASRGRLRGRNGDREYQGFHSEHTLRVAEGECRRLTLGLVFGQLEVKVFYPKGEVQRESYRTKDGKVRGLLPYDAISPLINTPSPLESLRPDPTDSGREGHDV